MALERLQRVDRIPAAVDQQVTVVRPHQIRVDVAERTVAQRQRQSPDAGQQLGALGERSSGAARGAVRRVSHYRSELASTVTFRLLVPNAEAVARSGNQMSNTLPRTAPPLSSTVNTSSGKLSMRIRVPGG